MYFLLKMINYYKNITVFGIKLVRVSRKDLIANPSTIKKFLKTKLRRSGYEARAFHDKEIS